MLTVKQTAEILKVSEPRVLKMIYDGRFGKNVPKFGKNWALDEYAVEDVRLEQLNDSRSNLSNARSSQPSHKARKKS